MPNRSARFWRFSNSGSMAATVGGGVGGLALVTSCLGSFAEGVGTITDCSTFQSTLKKKEGVKERRIEIRGRFKILFWWCQQVVLW